MEATIENSLPCEKDDLTFKTITTAVSKGVVVIEAAGNVFEDFDTYSDEQDRQIFNPNSPHFRDSGAILVGASTSDPSHARWEDTANNPPTFGSNFGKRIDCNAWGENVFTTTSNEPASIDLYTDSFGGTSAATAIIAGVALCVQGMAEAGRVGRRFKPSELRDILRDPVNGTKSKSRTDQIGAMPDLKRIIDNGVV